MRDEIRTGEFDFAHWVKLAKENPQEFEKQRLATIERFLNRVDDKDLAQRLRGLQWRIDMERKRAKNPSDAVIRIYDMMWESVSKNLEAIRELAICLETNKPQTPTRAKKRPHFATILPFKTRKTETVVEH